MKTECNEQSGLPLFSLRHLTSIAAEHNRSRANAKSVIISITGPDVLSGGNEISAIRAIDRTMRDAIAEASSGSNIECHIGSDCALHVTLSRKRTREPYIVIDAESVPHPSTTITHAQAKHTRGLHVH